MISVLLRCFVFLTVLTACSQTGSSNTQKGNTLTINLNWKQPPNEKDFVAFSSVIWRKYGSEGIILYSPYGEWDQLFVHFYNGRSLNIIEKEIRSIQAERAAFTVLSIGDSNDIPTSLEHVISCYYQACEPDAWRICEYRFPLKVNDVYEFTGRMLLMAMERAYPVKNITYEGATGSNDYDVVITFFDDCEYSEQMSHSLIENLEFPI